MKLRGIHIILIVILAVATLMITSSDSVVPYSRDTLFSNMHVYEGMVSLPEPLTTQQFNAAVTELNGGSAAATASDAAATGSTATVVNKDPKVVEGFALQPAPFGNSQVLDRFGSTPAGPQCYGQSSGYSKSLGPLCLSKEDARMLSTRGGNITGTDSTIGR
jgi:hypothetical protein